MRLTPTPDRSNREQLMLAAIRQHFRWSGMAPSYRELGALVGVEPKHVGGILEKLAQRRLLTFKRGVPRSIMLTDRTANLSDIELETAARERGLWPSPGTENGMAGEAMNAELTAAGMEIGHG